MMKHCFDNMLSSIFFEQQISNSQVFFGHAHIFAHIKQQQQLSGMRKREMFAFFMILLPRKGS